MVKWNEKYLVTFADGRQGLYAGVALEGLKKTGDIYEIMDMDTGEVVFSDWAI